MKRVQILIAFVILLFSFGVNAQRHLLIDSVSYLNVSNNFTLNDVWGYVDSSGTEYALVGRRDGFSVVSLADTLNPAVVYSDTNFVTLWRDIKVWKGHAYVTAEAPGGLAIYDLTHLPDSVVEVPFFNGVNYPFESAHNLFIDENGVAYIFGTKYSGGSYETVMLDVDTDPKNPIELGYFDANYLHDGFVRGDTLYGSAVNDGELLIIDVSNKLNPTIIARRSTPDNFTHNAWPSDNGRYIFTTDEVVGGYIAAYDLSNLGTFIPELDRIRSRKRTDIIPHNTHFINDFLVTSYYTIGVSIVDASKPDNLVEVGYFDTSPSFNGGSFNGNWGAYPYLPSGLLLLTDMEEGLYILRPKYQHASFLEGIVTDCNGNPISGAQVEVIGEDINIKTNLSGQFKTGAPIVGNFQMRVSKNGYNTRVVDNLTLNEGQVNNQFVELLDSNKGYLSVFADHQGKKIKAVRIDAENSDTIYSELANDSAQALMANISFGNYDLYIGKWGYENKCVPDFTFDCQNDTSLYILNEAVEDNFNTDLGWVVSGNDINGAWTREKPIGTVDQISVANPAVDDNHDCGEYAYITGNGFGQADNFDVDSTTILSSPKLNLNNFISPYVVFYTWFYCGGSNPSDQMNIYLVDTASNRIPIDTITNQNQSMYWQLRTYEVDLFVDKGAIHHIEFEVNDKAGQNILEAGVDNFFISEGQFVSIKENRDRDQAIKIYPNPTRDELQIIFSQTERREVRILNTSMQLIKSIETVNNKVKLDLKGQTSGLYFIQVVNDNGEVLTKKVIKH